jgi:transcriptional regulator with XRE-family HTH domain
VVPAAVPLREKRIGGALRRAREHAGMTIEDAAGQLGWSATKLSRLENGRNAIRSAALDPLIRLYKIADVHAHALRELAGPAGRTDRAVRDHDEAAEVLEWAPLAVPVPLRTADYARHIAHASQELTRITASAIARQVEDALTWQLRLTQPEDEDEPGRTPLSLQTLLDESVLYRQVHSRAVMAGQMHQLAELAELPNADLRVLPLAAGGPAGVVSPFAYYIYADVHGLPLADAVQTDGLLKQRIEDEDAVVLFRATFARLAAAALSREESAEMFRAMETAWLTPGERPRPEAGRDGPELRRDGGGLAARR